MIDEERAIALATQYVRKACISLSREEEFREYVQQTPDLTNDHWCVRFYQIDEPGTLSTTPPRIVLVYDVDGRAEFPMLWWHANAADVSLSANFSGIADLVWENAMPKKPDPKNLTPAAQLRACIDKLDPQHQKLFRSVRATVRKRLPAANELVYDYGRALVIGYSPEDRGIESIVAIRGSAAGVSLYFNAGPKLPDPKRLLRGSGKMTRFLEVESASQLKHHDVEALIGAAIELAKVALPAKGKRSLVFKSDGAKKPARQKRAPRKSTK
jgi:hypothetical protein